MTGRPKIDLMEWFGLGLSRMDLEMREYSLGGSDASKIAETGKGSHEAIQHLVQVKRKEADPPDLRDNLAVMLGTITEPLNAILYEHNTKNLITGRNTSHEHAVYTHLRCNVDGLVTLPTDEDVVWEAKYTSQTSMAAIVRKHYGQMQHNMTVTGRTTACVLSAIMGMNKYDHVLVEYDPIYADALIRRMNVVWRAVISDDGVLGELPPLPSLSLPPALLLPDPVDLTTVVNANELGFWISVFLETMEAAGKHEEAKEMIKKMLPQNAAEMHGFGATVRRNSKGAVSITKYVPPKAANDEY